MFAMNGMSVVRMISVIPAEAMMSPVAREISAKKTTSVDRMAYVIHVALTSLARGISAMRATTMTIPMGSVVNTAT